MHIEDSGFETLSMCSTRSFILRWLSIWTAKKFTDSVTFKCCPYIDIDVSLKTFLYEKLIRWVFLGFSFILHLSDQVKIWFMHFCNLRVILRIRGACARIAMLSANLEEFTCASRGWGMLLTYRISRIGERGLPLGTPQPATTCSKLTIETLEQKCEICSKLTIKPPKRRNGYNGIIRDIKFKFTFKTVFIESKDVNIILFQNVEIFPPPYFCSCIYLLVPILVEKN